MHDDLDVLGLDNIRAVLCGDVRTRERPNAEIKWHASPTDAKHERIFSGTAAVFNTPTILYESKRFVVLEEIDPHFFDDVLHDDVHLNYAHESSSAMARTGVQGPGGLELSVDARGLRVYARLPLDDLDVQRIAPKLDRGVVTQMSFAFTVAEEEMTVSTDERGREVNAYRLLRCQRLYDVCLAPLGAYSTTEASLRSLAAQLAAPDATRTSTTAQQHQTPPAPAPAPRDPRTIALAQGMLAIMNLREKRS